MSAKFANPYLNEYELQRVLALIGYLATHVNSTYVTSEKVNDSLPGVASPDEWVRVVKEHPEFFGLVDTDKLRLWARFHQSDTDRPSLDTAQVIELQRLAASFHEEAIRSESRRSQWTQFIVNSVLSFVGSILGSSLVASLIRWRN